MNARRFGDRRPRRLIRSGLVLLAAGVVLAGCAQSTQNDAQSTQTPAQSTETAAQSTHTPAQSTEKAARSTKHVNLGDSFSAGTGVSPLEADSPIYCQRSSKNYAHVVAEDEDYDLTDVSCAGADTGDFREAQHQGVPPQLDALDDDTDVVTLMIGGNDKQTYGRAIRLCSELADVDRSGAPCTDRYGSSLIDPVAADIYPAVRQALRDVRDRAPDARVLLVGYPWLLPPTVGCYPAMRLAEGDVPMIRELQTALNTYGRRAAEDEGVEFVDMSQVSEGHDACAGDRRWIEPMTTSGPGAVHPNEQGQAAIAEQVRKALAG
ncbi:SGNH/GDSL hydrolase family protein [Gordonia lacunae]|uniref:SGNH/GDSL hydrolase family protein n=1 Tax=Gordonia lacunae TaxID=417102 RepID=UPI0039E62BFF